MPQRRRVSGVPRDYVTAGEWPHGSLEVSAPVAVSYAAEIAARLAEAISRQGISQSELAPRADVARSTLHDVLTGRTWPDVVTLAKLETLLAVRLWPDRPGAAGE